MSFSATVEKFANLESFQKLYNLTSEVLGKGSYAEVYLGRRVVDHEDVAVKIISKSHLSEKDRKKLYAEVKILKKLRHRNVVMFYDAFESDEKVYIVMEYIRGGELFEMIVNEDKKLSESQIKRALRMMALGLQYCKNNGVIHRDIKPENVLVTSTEDDFVVKLADFNLSKEMDRDATSFNLMETMCGTPNYVSPEVLSGKPYDYKCDIWSFGVICYLLLSGGYLPFWVNETLDQETQRRELLQKVKKGKWGFTPESAWEGVSDSAKDFLMRVMDRKPESRLTYEEILAHEWLQMSDELEHNAAGEHEHYIDLSRMKKYNARRQVLAMVKVNEAASIFAGLMEEDGVNNSSSSFFKKLEKSSAFQDSGFLHSPFSF